MAKFNHRGTRPPVTSPVASTALTHNHEGAVVTSYDAKGELYLLAVTNMVSEAAFYEKGTARDDRYIRLIAEVAAQDPAWLTPLFPWLRTKGLMRSASLMGAAETAKTLCEAGHYSGVEDMIDGVLQRADEPGEFLAYWRGLTGSMNFPKRFLPVKQGLKRAVQRLYTERNWLKWDSSKADVRFADVIALTHPAPAAGWQEALFKRILDARHNRADAEIPESLLTLRAQAQWRAKVAEGAGLEGLVSPGALKDAGLTWEDVLSALGDKVDKKLLWEALIPNMGMMALARNLRNFDQNGVSDKVAAQAMARFADPDQVAKSKMFPFRFLAAHRNAPSLRWSYPLEQALNSSLANVPELSGRTLVLVDMSGSMGARLSDKSQLSRADAAAVFGAALALRSKEADLVMFGTRAERVRFARGESLLKILDRFQRMGGTNTRTAMREYYKGHDRAIVLTDGQSFDGDPAEEVPDTVPMYTWDLGGYGSGSIGGSRNRHVFGGLSDASFQAIPMLERGRSTDWPWM